MSVTIASVYWDTLSTTREFREPGKKGFHTVYTLDGVPVLGDPPSTLLVHRAQCRDYAGEGRYIPRLVLPEESEVFESTESEGDISAKLIANDILAEFGQAVPGTPGKGVWICANKNPTKQEIEQNTETQIILARYVIARMDRKWLSTRLPSLPLQRAAANWIGEQREWLHPTAASMLKQCPFCAKQTPSSAPVCQHCDRVHDKKRFAEVEAGLGSIEEVIAELEKKMPGTADVKAVIEGEQRGYAQDAEVIAAGVTSAKELQRDTISKSARDAFVKAKVAERQAKPEAVPAK